jgi:hypothetical protein
MYRQQSLDMMAVRRAGLTHVVRHHTYVRPRSELRLGRGLIGRADDLAAVCQLVLETRADWSL